jgi:purine-cytosine permease-like protein
MGRIMRKYVWIALTFVLAAAFWAIYLRFRLPTGIEAKGPTDWIPWVSLAGSVVSLLTGIVGLLLKIQELRTAKKA